LWEKPGTELQANENKRLKGAYFKSQAPLKQPDTDLRLQYDNDSRQNPSVIRIVMEHFGVAKGCIAGLGDNQLIWELGAE
jgi:hypothetical protein